MPPHRDAITDVPGIRVGHWTSRRAVTGCTVVLCEGGAIGGVDVRGAAPGTRETDLLRPGNLVEQVHAVLLSGGSAFGLDAAGGVVRYLEERGVGFPLGTDGLVVPIVPAAILMDLLIGLPRRPDAQAGYRAARSATGGRVREGSVGAGTGATVAKLAGRERTIKGGLGTASEALDSGVIVGAIAAVNAVGAIRDPHTGELIAAPRSDEQGRFVDLDALLRSGRPWQEPDAEDGEDSGRGGDLLPETLAESPANTTLAVIATNAALSKSQANRLATVCHDAFARTTWPAHTRGDGDVVFALATGAVQFDPLAYTHIEAMATRAVERAIVRGVRLATGLGGVPSAAEWAAG